MRQLAGFTRHLQARGYAVNTARSYKGAVRRFLHFQQGRTITAAAVESYAAELRARAGRSTVRGHLAALALWFGYLQRQGLADRLPAVPAPLPENHQGRREAP